MSTRAHRVIKIEYADAPTFNVSRNWDLTMALGMEGQGMEDVDIETIEQVLAEHTDIEPETRKALENDIAEAKKAGDTCITYDLF